MLTTTLRLDTTTETLGSLSAIHLALASVCWAGRGSDDLAGTGKESGSIGSASGTDIGSSGFSCASVIDWYAPAAGPYRRDVDINRK